MQARGGEEAQGNPQPENLASPRWVANWLVGWLATGKPQRHLRRGTWWRGRGQVAPATADVPPRRGQAAVPHLVDGLLHLLPRLGLPLGVAQLLELADKEACREGREGRGPEEGVMCSKGEWGEGVHVQGARGRESMVCISRRTWSTQMAAQGGGMWAEESAQGRVVQWAEVSAQHSVVEWPTWCQGGAVAPAELHV